MHGNPRDIPLALYLHFPWCVKKCPYCDFNSHALKAEQSYSEYGQVLRQDLRQQLQLFAGRKLECVFFGGGTPSLFPPDEVNQTLDLLRSGDYLADQAEITLEANPGTVEHGRFAEYRQAGINRVSLGAQTFNTDLLQAIGRIHGTHEIHQSVEEIRLAGIDNFNVDIMYGLPGQTLAQSIHDVKQVIALKPTHVSRYQLTIEPNTVFHAHPPELPDEDLMVEIDKAGANLLADAGWQQYEVSAWSRPGHECQHNLNYWRFGDYLGVGAGAHGKLGFPEHKVAARRVQPRHPDDYLGKNGEARQRLSLHEVRGSQLAFEFFLNATRLTEGFNIQDFEARTGLTEDIIEIPLRDALNRGLLEACGNRAYQSTDLGWRFLNDLQALFLPAAADRG